jgi:hypothetical protein
MPSPGDEPICPRLAAFVLVSLVLKERQDESVADTVDDDFDLLDQKSVVGIVHRWQERRFRILGLKPL